MVEFAIQLKIDANKSKTRECCTHAKKNIITACVSAQVGDLNIYFREIPYKVNERFLVCSDGVWEAMPIDEIEACLCEDTSETAENMAKKLLGLQERCNDNISFIIVENRNRSDS